MVRAGDLQDSSGENPNPELLPFVNAVGAVSQFGEIESI